MSDQAEMAREMHVIREKMIWLSGGDWCGRRQDADGMEDKWSSE